MQVFLLAVAVGFPFAVLFAWAYELTPDGIKREDEVDRDQSITQQTGRKLNRAIIVVLVAAVAFLLVDKFVLQGDSASTAVVTDTSIAVLPFVNMSSDPEQEYFSDGISEEILNVLAQVPNLHVTSRSSAFQFKGDDIDIPTVADQLGVRHVLEGSVRKSGSNVRITAQLIEAESDKHLWSASYDRVLTDTFAVQDEISAAIAKALGETLGFTFSRAVAERDSIDSEAYNEYLLGVYNLEQRSKESLEAAVRNFERAIDIEPGYAAAHARLAITFAILPGYSVDLNENEYFEKALPHSEEAFDLAPDTWEANLAMGYILSMKSRLFGDDVDNAIPYLEKGLELNPSHGPAYVWLAGLQSLKGDWAGRHAILEAGLMIAPLDRILLGAIANSYIYLDRFDEAQKVIDRLMDLSPAMALNRAATLATRQGRWADNAVALIHYLSLAPTESNFWARRIVSEDLGLPEEALTIGAMDRNLRVYVTLGREDEAINKAQEELEAEPNLGNRWLLATVLAWTGQMESAHTHFEAVLGESENTDFYVPSSSHIAARVATGDMEGAWELVRILDEEVERKRDAGIDVAPDYLGVGYAHYVVGDKETGLAALEKTVGLGFYVPVFQSFLEELVRDPAFAPLLAAQQEKQRVQQERFLTIMCGPDNPVPHFWRPSDAACNSLSELAIE
jgi:TolB-like protein